MHDFAGPTIGFEFLAYCFMKSWNCYIGYFLEAELFVVLLSLVDLDFNFEFEYCFACLHG